MQNKLMPHCKTKQERVAFWYSIYKASLTSNFTKVKFCAQYNISDASLYRWSKYFEKQLSNNELPDKANANTTTSQHLIKKNKNTESAVFLPIHVKQAKTKDLPQNHPAVKAENLSNIELLFPNGVKLIFNQEININLLMQLIAARSY